jgi:chloride channel protein, CIC family
MKRVIAAVDRLRAREEQLFLVLTVVVGVLAGLSAVLFSLSIDVVSRLLFGLAPSSFRLFVIPVLGSLLSGLLLAKVITGVRGSGVPQTKAAFHLTGGVIPAHVPFGKFLTGVICIGTGQSMGREGPSVQIGAGLASLIGRWLHLSPRRVRDLVPVGAAGALAAAFNTPVAAVLFALEEIIGDTNAPLLGSTVVASVSSVIVERSLLGNEPLFHVPTYHLEHPAELGAYAVLGVIGGILSLLFSQSLLRLRAAFLKLPRRTAAFQPVVGGLVVGFLLLVTPAVMGVGYDYVDQALNGELLLPTLAALCFLKLIATTVSYASGNAGGIFAPSLYIGAMAGGALGIIVHTYAPFPTADPGAYALVGMGTLFAGIIRAPMTSVFMIFEITQDYQILVPLMVANLLSFLVARRLQPLPVYEALLRQDHVHLRERSPGPPRGATTAGELMMVTTQTLDAVPPVHVHADDSLPTVIERLADSDGSLPVVSRADSRVLEGQITMDSIQQTFRARRSQANNS